jgi:hypothetical protein
VKSAGLLKEKAVLWLSVKILSTSKDRVKIHATGSLKCRRLHKLSGFNNFHEAAGSYVNHLGHLWGFLNIIFYNNN